MLLDAPKKKTSVWRKTFRGLGSQTAMTTREDEETQQLVENEEPPAKKATATAVVGFWKRRLVWGLLLLGVVGMIAPSLLFSHSLDTTAASTASSKQETTEEDAQPFSSSVYTSLQEQKDRSKRFPSIEERVKVYTGVWYLPPCSDSDKIPYQYNAAAAAKNKKNWQVAIQEVQSPRKPQRQQQPAQQQAQRVFYFSNTVEMETAFVLEPNTIKNCTTNPYCPDVKSYMLPSLKRLTTSSWQLKNVPIVLQFGDSDITRGYVTKDMLKSKNAKKGKKQRHLNLPIIRKFRASFGGIKNILALSAKEATCITSKQRQEQEQQLLSLRANSVSSSPQFLAKDLIWRLTSQRHYSMLPKIPKADVTAWKDKKNKALFRGDLTGINHHVRQAQIKQLQNTTTACRLMDRCRLVYDHAHSPLVDAQLVKPKPNSKRPIPDSIGNIQLYGAKMSFEEQLQYKAIIMLEGNDVSSGLKWALYSETTVVLMTVPTKTSWAMEELLLPWIHYIPLNDALDNVEEQMEWIIQHDEEAKQIAYRGSLWIKDLFFHPKSVEEDERINDEILKRYHAHYKEEVSN